MRLLILLTYLFHVSLILAQPNVGIEISPSSVLTQPISTLSLRATAYSSLPACDIISYLWSTIMTPIDITLPQPIFTTPNDRITSITGLTTLGTYVFQLVVGDSCLNSTTLKFNSIVANSSLEIDFLVLPPTLVTTPGFVFPPTLPPTLPPTTSAPTTIAVDPSVTTPPVDPALTGPTDPNTGLPIGGGVQQPNPNPPITNAGNGGINTSSSNSSFNIMYVIIPAAVVAGLMLIGICMYCRRKEGGKRKISAPFQAFTGANQLTSPV